MRGVQRADAVSPVIGFLLIVGILATFVAVLQTSAVPVWNTEVELDHSDRVQGDVQRFGAAVTGVAADGSREGVPVALGVGYPNRVVLSNLPAATGSFSLTRDRTTIDGARAVDPEVRDYWNGSPHSFDDGYAVYEPSYRYRDGGSLTVADHGAVYNLGPDGSTGVLREPSLVDGNRVRLVALRGPLGVTGSRTETVDLFPDSAVRNAVTVTNTSAKPVTVTVPTRLDADWWREQLDDPRVVDVRDAADGRVAVELERGERYRLALGAVGVNGRTVTPPRYVDGVAGDGARVGVGEPVELVAEVRDRFDNPVFDAPVTATLDGDGTVDGAATTAARTDGDGRVSVTYVPTSTGDASVRVSLDGRTGPAANATFNVTATTTDGGGGGSDDGEAPRIDDLSVSTEVYTDCTFFGCDVLGEQAVIEYTVSDTGSGVRTVDLAVNDTVGQLSELTATTQTVDDAASHDGQWVTPMIASRQLRGNDIGNYAVTVRVVDAAGNEAVAVADVPSP